MQTRREQVRAHRFVTRRLVSALLSGEPETTELPMRRLGLAMVASVLVAAILFAGFGAYGLLSPGGAKPDSGTVVIERETGARYVFVNDVLYPVLNFASARLILGAEAPTRTLAQNSLQGLTRGPQVGIAGAPDGVPAPGALVGLPWTVCSAAESSAVATPVTRLLIGQDPPTGRALGDDAVLVAAGSGATDRYLIWQNRRYRIKDGETLAALRLSGQPVLPIGRALLNAVTSGPDLVPLVLPNMGQFSTRQVKGAQARVGRVYHVGAQHYVLTSAGLAAIGDVSALLLLAKGGTDDELTAEQAGSLLLDSRLDPPGFPAQMPEMRAVDPVGSALCAGYGAASRDGQDVALAVADAGALRAMTGGRTAADQVSRGVQVADQVLVQGGHAALVRAIPAADATVTEGLPAYLVTDEGRRYAMPAGTAAQESLGYGSVTPVPVPAALVALIPPGPPLDPATARNFSAQSGAVSGS
ncbi:type VII secretion protein EccB [Actinoplanes philippinensis]|uniref:type VII secretion protein EccB n=1 Tax=Actinoplanes philippinensis TaxID=35752 RepID=UPI003404AC16